jgi:hypothetical protein
MGIGVTSERTICWNLLSLEQNPEWLREEKPPRSRSNAPTRHDSVPAVSPMIGYAVGAAGRCQGLQEIFPDETADETRGFGKVEPDGKRAELGRKPRAVAVCYRTQQNEGLRNGSSKWQLHGSSLESVERYKCRGVAQPGSAPALGAEKVLPKRLSHTLVFIVSNNLGNLLFVQS